MTDPGCFTVDKHVQLENIDALLFTHEHPDHYHLESLKSLLDKNPKVTIFANTSVAELLEKENITYQIIRDGETVDYFGIKFSGYGVQHSIQHIYWPLSANTGYMIDEKLFYPGDALTDPKKPVDILALPVA